MQLDQKLAQKQKLLSQILECSQLIEDIQINLAQSGVKMFGSIADFKVLAIHKNTMKEEKKKLIQQKSMLDKEVLKIDSELIEFNKEIEQYKHLLDLQKQEEMKKLQKYEELVASEYVQAKWKSEQ